MKKLFSLFIAMMAAISINAETVFDWAGKVGSIQATGTIELDSKVKIKTHTEEVPAIKFANGYSIDTTKTPAVHANYVELSIEGGFKKGDVVKVEFCYNNSAAKVATVGVYNLEGEEIAVSGEGANARLTNDITSFNYALTEDMEKIRLARAKTGKTTTFVISLVVVRGEEVEVKALYPQFSALPGKYFEPFKLALYTTEEGAKIFCHLDGKGDFAEFADSIEINDYDKTYVVEAYATKEGALNSDIVKGEFKLEHFVARPVFNARKTYRLDSIQSEDIRILSGNNAEKTTYSIDGQLCPAVNYLHMYSTEGTDSVMRISFAGCEGLTLRYKNTANKNNILKIPAKFTQCDTKNFEIWIDNVQGGDTIVFVATAKGSTPQFSVDYSTASYLLPYMPEDDSDPCFTDGFVFTGSDARTDENYIGWQNLVYVVEEGHTKVRIKEVANGFRLAKILVGAYRGDKIGQCGKDYALTWTFDSIAKTLTISGNGSFDENMECGAEAKAKMEKLIIEEGVTAIGNEAFSNCANLAFVQLPTSVKTIGERAFYNCLDLTSIYNYRENPCLIKSSTFEEVNTFDCTLYVLSESVAKYRSEGSGWKIFYDIKSLGAQETSTEEVQVEPAATSAAVVWPSVEGAATYELVIKDKSGNVICTLVFNSNGQLIEIAFQAPSRTRTSQQEQMVGFSFVVTGLEEGKEYDLTITAKDSEGEVLETENKSFKTMGGATAIDNTSAETTTTKLIRNGHILILRGDKTYTVTGQQVR